MQAVRVGVGLVPTGRMSTYLNTAVDVGDTIAVMPPLGSFVVPVDPRAARVMVSALGQQGYFRHKSPGPAEIFKGKFRHEAIIFFSPIHKHIR